LQELEGKIEYDQSIHPFRRELIFNAISLEENGKIAVSTSLGFGIEVNKDVINEFREEVFD